MVIDFSAKWCGPCKLMDPVMKDFAARYTDVEFINLDVDELMVCYKIIFHFNKLFIYLFNVRASLYKVY
jgi:thiol-disulfide isomerase/thioredoxin